MPRGDRGFGEIAELLSVTITHALVLIEGEDARKGGLGILKQGSLIITICTAFNLVILLQFTCLPIHLLAAYYLRPTT